MSKPDYEQRFRVLSELVLAFCGGFMERGTGALIYQRINPKIAARLREYVDSMRKAAE